MQYLHVLMLGQSGCSYLSTEELYVAKSFVETSYDELNMVFLKKQYQTSLVYLMIKMEMIHPLFFSFIRKCSRALKYILLNRYISYETKSFCAIDHVLLVLSIDHKSFFHSSSFDVYYYSCQHQSLKFLSPNVYYVCQQSLFTKR